MPATRPVQSTARAAITHRKRSPRSSVVDLIVLSTDHALLTTMQAAVEAELLFTQAATAESAVEHFVAGRCGILLVDLACLRGGVQVLLSRLHAQFPGIVLMVAGRREDEATVGTLITSGVIYRFVHKPLSPGRASQFMQAALRRHREINRQEPFGLATVREMVRVQLWQRLFDHSVTIGAVVGGLVTTALIGSAVRHALQPDPVTPPAAIAVPSVDRVPRTMLEPTQTERAAPAAPQLAVEQLVREAQHLVTVGRLNEATRHVREVAALTPEDPRVAILAMTIGQQLLTRTMAAIGEKNFELAARRLDAARTLDREFNLALPDLQATEHALELARESDAPQRSDASLGQTTIEPSPSP